MQNYKNRSNRYSSFLPGQAMMTIVLFTLFIGSAGVLAFSFVSLGETAASRNILQSERSYFLAEAGLEDVIYRMKNGKSYSTYELLSLDGSLATTTTTSLGSTRTIETQGSVQGGVRKVRATMAIGAGASFNYGVQVGRGGFLLENNSAVSGSVHAGGTITLKDDGAITGDAFVSSTSQIIGNKPKTRIGGHARAHTIVNAVIDLNATSSTAITNSAVARNAYADTIIDSSITKDAYYVSSITGSTVGGLTIATSSTPQDLPDIPLPISDSDIGVWENIAAAGGVHSSPCPYVIDDITISIGPLKIDCDLTIQGDADVTLTGPVWVAGDIDLKNNVIVRLPPSYGASSEVLIADNPSDRITSSKIITQNNAITMGSGSGGSYIIFISQNNSSELGGNETAIFPQNNATNSVLYAAHGEILLQNNAGLKEATAYLIHMKNNAVLLYETGLEEVVFSSGPGGGYDIASWKEVE